MFKQITACILLVAISSQILNRAVISIDYYTNTAAFAKNCINNARPMMHCNGKCQMMKKLRAQDKKDSQAPERRSFNNEIISSKSFFALVNYCSTGNLLAYSRFPESDAIHMPRSFFHPPGV